jgi:phosphate transport system permease protein
LLLAGKVALLHYKFKKKSRILDFIGEKIITICAFSAIIAVLLIFVFIFKEALPIFTDAAVQKEASLGKMLFKQVYYDDRPAEWKWQPNSEIPKYSLLPLFVGTIKATLIAMLIAIPLGVGAAVYSAEFAPKRLREIIKPIIELLAGIPSVVLGFFALIIMATGLQNLLGLTFRLNALNAGIALGLAVVPIIFSISEDAMTSVPGSLREASLALGASPWQVSFTMVLPAALPGIGAGIVLGFGRAVGETMIVLMASGNAAIISTSLTDSIRTFSATIAAELAEVVFGSAHYNVLFFIGSLLFVFTFIINMGGDLILTRLKQRIQGRA